MNNVNLKHWKYAAFHCSCRPVWNGCTCSSCFCVVHTIVTDGIVNFLWSVILENAHFDTWYQNFRGIHMAPAYKDAQGTSLEIDMFVFEFARTKEMSDR